MPDFRRGFKAEADRLAVRLRAAVGIGCADRLEPADLCREFDILLQPLSGMREWNSADDVGYLLSTGLDRFSAAVMPIGMRRIIIFNDRHAPVRQRSSICHELSHCFLGHDVVAPLTDDGERSYDSEAEREANFMAGLLLLPNESAHHVARSGMADNVAAAHFGVSPPMLAFRMRMSGAQKAAQRRAERTGAN